METHKMPALPQNILDVFFYFLKHYVPVDKIAAAQAGTVEKTTAEIYKDFQQHCPSDLYGPDIIYSFLLDNGFTYDTPEGELDFLWKMKFKKD